MPQGVSCGFRTRVPLAKAALDIHWADPHDFDDVLLPQSRHPFNGEQVAVDLVEVKIPEEHPIVRVKVLLEVIHQVIVRVDQNAAELRNADRQCFGLIYAGVQRAVQFSETLEMSGEPVRSQQLLHAGGDPAPDFPRVFLRRFVPSVIGLVNQALHPGIQDVEQFQLHVQTLQQQ